MTITRRRAVRAAAPVAGLLVAGLLTYSASTAAFTASTTSPGNSWEAGQVTLTNSTGPGNSYLATGQARFSLTGIVPGQQQQRCITVRSDGGFAGGLRFHTANVGGTGLQNRLRIRVQRAVLPTGTGAGTTIPAGCAGYPAGSSTTIHNAFLPNLPTSYASATNTVALPAGVTSNVAYRIRWTFVSTGSSAGDNPFQGTSAQADLVWELQ
jgi:hypothetical protein